MNVNDSNIVYARFSDMDAIVSKRIDETLSSLFRKERENDGMLALPLHNLPDDKPNLTLMKCHPIEELVNDELYLMMVLWKKSKSAPYSQDEICILLKQEEKNPTLFLRVVVPQLIRKGFLVQQIVEKHPFYEIGITHTSYAKSRFLTALESATGHRSLFSYVASLYDEKMIDDDDLENLYWWIAATRGYLDGEA